MLVTLCTNGCLYIISFVRIYISLTNLVFETKIGKEFVIPNEVSEAILNTNKRII